MPIGDSSETAKRSDKIGHDGWRRSATWSETSDAQQPALAASRMFPPNRVVERGVLSGCFRIWLFAVVVTLISPWMQSADAQNWVVSEQRGGLLFFSEAAINVDSISNELKALRKELSNVVSVESANTPVELIIFRSHSSYQKYLKSSLPDALQRRAIFYRRGDTFQIYSWNHRELIKDLRHEYTHALLHQVLPYVPLWVDEGLAEYFEDRPGTRLKSSRFASVKWKARTGWKPSLTGLERIPSASRMSQQNYMDSWAWVAYLLNDSPDSFTTFRAYLNAISIGEAPGAFSEYVAQRAPAIPNRVGSYFRRIRISLR